MDLLQTVRKEGSRGGVNFSWDDVRSSPHRENYLGHSIMAPVGRWQKGKDLTWYAKANNAELTPEERIAKGREARREEMRKIKEAEEDAMARALGLPVPDKANANNEPLGVAKIDQNEVSKAFNEVLADGEDDKDRVHGLSGREEKEYRSGDYRRRDRSRSRDRRNRRHGEDRGGRRPHGEDRGGRRPHGEDRGGRRQRDEDGDERHRHSRYHHHRVRSHSRDRQHRDHSRDRRHHSHSRNRRHRSRSRDRRHREHSKERRHRDHSRDKYGDRPKSRSDYNERPRSRDKERKRERSRSRSPYVDRRRRRDSR